MRIFFSLSLLLLAFCSLVVLAAEDESASLAEHCDENTIVSLLTDAENFGSAAGNFQAAWALSQLNQVSKSKGKLCKAAAADLTAAVSNKKQVDLPSAGNALKLAQLLSCDGIKDSAVETAVGAAKDALKGNGTPDSLLAAVSVLASTKGKNKMDGSEWSNAVQSIVELQREDGTPGMNIFFDDITSFFQF